MDMNKTRMVIDGFSKHAESYQERFMDVGLYHDTFDIFCKHIGKENAQILEIACGPGNITRYLLSKHPDYKILGIDFSANMLQLAAQNNPTATFLLMDGRDIGTMTSKYDAIMCGFCLPYLSKEEVIGLIDDAYSILTEKGVLYFSTMEDDYSKSGMQTSSKGDQMYVHYHQADYLTQHLIKTGFGIIAEQHLSYLEPNGKHTTDLVLIASK